MTCSCRCRWCARPATAVRRQRTARRCTWTVALGRLDETSLVAPSELPDWSRLTIACHLRFGAEAFRRMTEAAIAGEPASYYPEGRDAERPTTLVPRPSDRAVDVVGSLAHESAELHGAWRA